MPKIAAVACPKGGVGKTTLTTALSLYLSEKKIKHLLIDLDNIFSLSNNFRGATKVDSSYPTVMELFTTPANELQTPLKNIIAKPINEYMDLIQGTGEIAEISTKDPTTNAYLKQNLNRIKDLENYHYILIDTPAGTGNAVQSALRCADFVWSPIDLDNNAISSLDELIHIMKPIQERLNTKLTWCGYVINRVQKIISINQVKLPEATSDRKIYNDLLATHGNTYLLGMVAFRNSIKTSASNGTWSKNSANSAVEGKAELQKFCVNFIESMN